jgi:hypothetical protein
MDDTGGTVVEVGAGAVVAAAHETAVRRARSLLTSSKLPLILLQHPNQALADFEQGRQHAQCGAARPSLEISEV